VLANVMSAMLDGVDLVGEFRGNEQLRRVPIVLYSSPADRELCIEGLEAGANDYLITPYSERELLARIGAQLRASQMCDESFHALRVSEERYRTLANTLNSGTWMASANGDIVGEARGWEDMTGQTPEEYRGYNWIAAVHPDDKQRVLEVWQKALRDGTCVTVDYRVKQRNGSYHYIRAQGTPIHNPDNTVREWIGTIRDIDQPRQALEALRTSEEQFRANFELAGIGQAQVEPETGRMLRVNPRFCEMVGYSAEELLTKTFWDITHPEDVSRPV
jgi:PAS domain S-box-containing protein